MTSKATPAAKDSQPAVPPIMARIAHLMASIGISGLPRNYELLFEALNGNAGVAREIAALGKAPEQSALDSIALRHALPSHNALAAGQAAGEAVRLLGEIAQASDASRRSRSAAVQELEEISARMQRDPVLGISDFAADTARLLCLVHDILGADRAATGRIGDLQARLDALRSGLSVSREALTHDPVTGLANHAALAGRLKAFFHEEAEGTAAALLLLRVDALRDFAESHPPGAAEKTLKQLAAIFRQSVKKHDYVARTGPDLFCLLLSDVSRENILPIARRIAQHVAEKSFAFQDRELPAGFLSLTAGVAMSDTADAPTTFYEQAEQALAYATDSGIALRVYSAEVAARSGRTYRAAGSAA